MLTLIATYFMTFAAYSLVGDSPHFLVLLDANGQPNFKTSCLSREQHCIGKLYLLFYYCNVLFQFLCIAKMEVSVVGVDPTALTMTSIRDVIISYRDNSANITYYLQVKPSNNSTVIATEVLV